MSCFLKCINMRCFLFTAILILFVYSADSQGNPLPAESILQKAYLQAAKEKKNVFVIFGASWCSWCHKMDSAMNDTSCKEMFLNNYVIVHLDVLESKGRANLENPSAFDTLKKYHGEDQGIPFWLIFNPVATLLADSKIRASGASFDMPGNNIACPASEKEVTYFVDILKRTSSLSKSQLVIVETRFRKNQE
jgi:thiol-disulfide isomerase/thioredoxin